MAGIDTSIYNRPPPTSPLSTAQDIGSLMNTIEQNQLLRTQVDIQKLGLANTQIQTLLGYAKGVEAVPPDLRPKEFQRVMKLVVDQGMATEEEAIQILGQLPEDPREQDAYFASTTSWLQSIAEQTDTLFRSVTQDTGAGTLMGTMNVREGQPTWREFVPRSMSPGEAAGAGADVPFDIRPPVSIPGPLPSQTQGMNNLPGYGPPDSGLEGVGGPQNQPRTAAPPISAPTPQPSPENPPAPTSGSPAEDFAAGFESEPQMPPGFKATEWTSSGTPAQRALIDKQVPMMEAVQTAGADAVQQKTFLRNMQVALSEGHGFESGPMTEAGRTMVAAWNQMAKAMDMDDWTYDEEGVRNAEEFRKFAYQMAQGLAAAAGATDQRERTAMGASPNTDLSTMGNERIIKMLLGNWDFVALKASLAANVDPHDYRQFETKFNNIVDPRVLQMRHMTPDEIAEMKAEMKPEQWKVLTARAREMARLKWIPRQ